jgi:hypothetical protein
MIKWPEGTRPCFRMLNSGKLSRCLWVALLDKNHIRKNMIAIARIPFKKVSTERELQDFVNTQLPAYSRNSWYNFVPDAYVYFASEELIQKWFETRGDVLRLDEIKKRTNELSGQMQLELQVTVLNSWPTS